MKKLLLLVGLVVFLTTFETNADKPNIYFCEMHQFAEVGRDKIKEYELEKFRFERFE